MAAAARNLLSGSSQGLSDIRASLTCSKSFKAKEACVHGRFCHRSASLPRPPSLSPSAERKQHSLQMQPVCMPGASTRLSGVSEHVTLPLPPSNMAVARSVYQRGVASQPPKRDAQSRAVKRLFDQDCTKSTSVSGGPDTQQWPRPYCAGLTQLTTLELRALSSDDVRGNRCCTMLVKHLQRQQDA